MIKAPDIRSQRLIGRIHLLLIRGYLAGVLIACIYSGVIRLDRCIRRLPVAAGCGNSG
jgi:hypothetical protein